MGIDLAKEIKTKIVATIGSMKHYQDLFNDKRLQYSHMIQQFAEKGVDVIRLNMAHFTEGFPSGIDEFFQDFGGVHRALRRKIALLLDLQGPKIRTADYPIRLSPRQRFTLRLRKYRGRVGGRNWITILYGDNPFEEGIKNEGLTIDLAADVEQVFQANNLAKQPTWVYLGDGDALLKVISIDMQKGEIHCEVEAVRGDGKIAGYRGVTFKGLAKVRQALPCLTPTDRQQLDYLLRLHREHIAFVALSFVKGKGDIMAAKNFMKSILQSIGSKNPEWEMPGLIAKIETPEAVKHIDEIIDEADGIMVARGDLGLQGELRDVPGVQKEIIHKCNLKAKPVITATQMLDSMEKSPEPTRAEVADVYNAIFDGTDALMLSGETAAGQHPLRAIQKLREIARQAENGFFQKTIEEKRFRDLLDEIKAMLQAITPSQWAREWIAHCISYSACSLSTGFDEGIRAIVTPTALGQTARRVSRFRPKVPIIAAVYGNQPYSDVTKRKLLISFGVYPLDITILCCATLDEVFREVGKQAKEEGEGYIRVCDYIVLTAGDPNKPGATNTVRVHQVTDC